MADFLTKCSTVCTLMLTVTAITAGCGSPAKDAPSDTQPSPAATAPASDGQASRKAFLDEKRTIPAGKEWARDITSGPGGTFTFRVASQGPFSVSVLKDNAYQALTSRSGAPLNQDDVLLTVDSPEPELEKSITVGPRSTWFIIQNQTDNEVEFHFQCFAP